MFIPKKKLEKNIQYSGWKLVKIIEKWQDIIIKKSQRKKIIPVTDRFKQFVDQYRKIIWLHLQINFQLQIIETIYQDNSNDKAEMNEVTENIINLSKHPLCAYDRSTQTGKEVFGNILLSDDDGIDNDDILLVDTIDEIYAIILNNNTDDEATIFDNDSLSTTSEKYFLLTKQTTYKQKKRKLTAITGTATTCSSKHK